MAFGMRQLCWYSTRSRAPEAELLDSRELHLRAENGIRSAPALLAQHQKQSTRSRASGLQKRAGRQAQAVEL